MEQKYSTGVRWILYIVSFLFGVPIGLIIGIYFMVQEDEESRQVGKNCLIAVIINFVVGCLCGLCWFFFAGGMALMGGASSALLLPVI